MAANLKDIKAHMKGYRLQDLASRDVQSVTTHYKDLKIGSDNFVHNDGRKELLFRLKGTIPVDFRGTTYNIPIVIWFQKAHPQTNPIVFVTPTSDMSVNPSRYVDSSGRVYLPYISEWKQGRSDTASLIQILCVTFAENIPVYSRQQQQTSTPPTTSYRPPPGPGYGQNIGSHMPYPNSSPVRPPYPTQPQPPPPQSSYMPTPYPVQSSMMPTPGGAGAGSYPPYSTGAVGYRAPYPPPQGGPTPYPPYPQGTGMATSQPLLSAEEERKKIEEEEKERAKAKRISLESAVEDKIKRQLQSIVKRAEDEMKTLKDTQTKLTQNNEKLNSLLQEMDTKQHEADNSIEMLKEKTAELDSAIEYLQTQPDKVDVDDSITATNPVHNQILRLYAEENAIDDTIYYLGEALRREVITPEVFLKHVRDLSRKQFMARATIIKAREVAKLPPHGVPG